MTAASEAGALKEGPAGSAWFAHRDTDGQITGIEMRGPEYRGFSPGGEKTVFRLAAPNDEPKPCRGHRGADRRDERCRRRKSFPG